MQRSTAIVLTEREAQRSWRRAVWVVCGALCLLAVLGRPALAQNADAEAAAAWQKLQQDAQAQLQSAESRAEAMEVMKVVRDDLETFADEHEGTQLAAVALLNHAMLSRQLDDDETAVRSLDKALERAEDPHLQQMIQMQIAQLSLKEGTTPPNYSASTMRGDRINPADFEGKVVLLDFWATWCVPCIMELPNLRRVYDEHGGDDFEIISISIDDQQEVVEEFLASNQLPWTHVWNGAMPEGEDLATAYGVTAIPQMILIGRDGKIAAMNVRGPTLEAAVEAALKAEPAEAEADATEEAAQ